MSRPTPSVSLCEKDAIALKTIMENSPEDSSHFKRAAVILACAEGKQGKDIAKEYHITPNMVINWRRKFENGGVDGLMSDAPRPGKRVTDDKTISSPTQLSTKKSLDNTPSETVPNVSDTIKHIIQEKKVQIIGLFLTLSVQIIALVISPLSKESPFPKGKCITVNTGSTQSQEQTTDDIEILDVTNTLRCLPSLTPREETNPTEDAFNFIENLKNSLEETGSQLYLVLNAPDPVALVQDQSCIGMQLSSVEEFKSTASLWLRSLEGGNHWVSDVFSKHLTRLLNTAPTHCAPFTWQVTPKEYHPKTASSTRTLSAGENEVTFSITYKDSTGATRTCSKVLVNEIPNSEDFSQCKTIYDFQRLAGKLEQGIIRGSQELGNAFMKETIQAGSSKDQKKKKKARNHE